MAGKISARAKRAIAPVASAIKRTFYGAMDQLLPGSGRRLKLDPREVFAPARPMPGVLPKRDGHLAMDEAPASPAFMNWAMSGLRFSEGLMFLGYPYLSDLAQRSEYRRGVETIAGDMTRAWIEFGATGDKKKGEKIAAIEERLQEIGAQHHLNALLRSDGFFGRGHLYIDTGDGDDALELAKTIGNGRDAISKQKVSKKHPLKGLKVIEPVWTYAASYNASNPLKSDWYNPSTWYVMGTAIHVSRLLTLVGRPVPDMLKPAYSFGGLALTQLAKDSVDIWLRARDGVGDIISSFTTFVLGTDMGLLAQDGGEESLAKRVALFTNYRDNRGLMILDKETESFANVSAPLGTLDTLQQQALEHVATAFGIPLVKFVGDQPAGLNASSEGAIRMYYDRISADQHSQLRPILQTIIDFVQLSLFDEIDHDLSWKFKPLWEMDAKQLSDIIEARGRTDQAYVDMGAISPEEVRTRLANDPESPYDGLDPDDMPDLKFEEEFGGLEPKGSTRE